jgi:dolichyl-phosphate-mannose--protein O-mannosyl transferase
MSSDSDDENDILPLSTVLPKSRFFNYNAVLPYLTNIFPEKGTPPLILDATDAVAIIVLLAIGIITRTFRIHHPRSVVFDEVCFGDFTNWYLTGDYFTDIHPPLGKLIMAGIASLTGYKGDFKFQKLMQKGDYPTMEYVALRMTPAFFGALCVPLIYFGMRSMLGSRFASFVSSLFIAFDLMMIAESRHILSDGLLHFFSCLSLVSIFAFERFNNLFMLMFEAISLGCVAACKYTSGGLIVLACIRQFNLLDLSSFKRELFGSIFRSGILVSTVILIHFLAYAIHLHVIPYRTDEIIGSPRCVLETLVERPNPDWNRRHGKHSTLYLVVALMLTMHQGNMELPPRLPFASKWYEWPLCMGKSIIFWGQGNTRIVCLGNVFVYWPVFFAIIINLVRVCFSWDFSSEESGLLCGYLVSFLPFALITRDCFVYHYAIPLIVGCCNLGLLIDRKLPPVARGFAYSMFAAMALFGYVFWFPWIYGFEVPDLDFLSWSSRW